MHTKANLCQGQGYLQMQMMGKEGSEQKMKWVAGIFNAMQLLAACKCEKASRVEGTLESKGSKFSSITTRSLTL